MALVHRNFDPSAVGGGESTYTLRVDAASGNDSYTYAQVSGDPDTYAWATITRALRGTTTWNGSTPSQAAQAGDTILVEPGTYSVNRGGNSSTYSNPSYAFVNSGTQGNPIIVKARYPASTDTNPAHRTILQHTNGEGQIIGTDGKNYVYFDGFYIDEDDAPGNAEGLCWLYGSTRSGIVNCEVLGFSSTSDPDQYGDNHNLIRMEGDDYSLCGNNKIHRHYVSSADPNEAGILSYHSHRGWVENCEVYDCDGGGINMKAHDNNNTTDKITGMTIRKNLIYDTSCAIQLWKINNWIATNYVYQNIIHSSTYGIHCTYDDNTHPYGIQIVNNTIDATNGTGKWRPGITLRGANTGNALTSFVVRNNIVSNIPGSIDFPYALHTNLSDTEFDAKSMDIDYNWYYSNNSHFGYNCGSNSCSNSMTFANWQSAGYDANGSTSNPTYEDAANDDFRLQVGSGARNAGTDFLNLLGGGTSASINVGAYITSDMSDVIGLDSNYDYSWHYA